MLFFINVFHDGRSGKIRDYSDDHSVYILEHCASQPTSSKKYKPHMAITEVIIVSINLIKFINGSG